MKHHWFSPIPVSLGFQRASGRHLASCRPERAASSCFILAVVLSGLCSLAFSARAAGNDQGERLLALLHKMESHYASLNDYSAIFRKQERIKNKIYDERLIIKFQKPLKVYMKWIDIDREALYVEGEYDNKILVHRGGLLGFKTWKFNPWDYAPMLDNRHPVTEIGFGFILGIMHKDFTTAVQYGEVEITRLDDESFDGRPSTIIEATFTPHEGRQYYTTRLVCHVDKEFMLPVGIACYDEKGDLQELYTYEDVKLNPGLTDLDFSNKNKQYHF